MLRAMYNPPAFREPDIAVLHGLIRPKRLSASADPCDREVAAAMAGSSASPG